MKYFMPIYMPLTIIAVLMMLWAQIRLGRGDTIHAFLSMLNGIGIALVAIAWAIHDRKL